MELLSLAFFPFLAGSIPLNKSFYTLLYFYAPNAFLYM